MFIALFAPSEIVRTIKVINHLLFVLFLVYVVRSLFYYFGIKLFFSAVGLLVEIWR